MDRTMKIQIVRICTSFILFLFSFFLGESSISFLLFFLSYLLIGYDILWKAIRNLFRGKLFDENFLMTIATIGAFFIGEFPEGVAVMLFYQVGEFFQDYAVDKSRKSIVRLMDIRPDYANKYQNGKVLKVDPSEIKIGEIILIKPGEKIPLDGKVIEGDSTLNTVAITGESVPKKVKAGDLVYSGCVNNDKLLKVEVTKKFEESTVSKILDLVENASSRKSKSENFIHKFAKYYTPIVVLVACFLAIIPPLVLSDTTFHTWVYRALSFLVVSCPCALVISIPLSFFGGIGAASKMGVLIKGSNYLEALANTEIVVCDKTGTLTEGVFSVQKVNPVGFSEEEVLQYASYAEIYSNHPISISIKQAYGKEIEESLVKQVKEISGKGVFAIIDQKEILVGNEKLMKEGHISYEKNSSIGTIVYVAIDHKFAGSIVISDKIKDDSYSLISSLKKNQVQKVVMLTGDLEEISKQVADQLKIDEYHAELLPQEKVSYVETLKKEKSEQGKLVFLGDGINDAPVLALSDIGIAMGGLGSDAAIEAADVVIMTDEPSKVARIIKLSKKTMRIVKENIVFAIAVKIGVLILSAFGLTNMWVAVFADVGVSILAVFNALRILKSRDLE